MPTIRPYRPEDRTAARQAALWCHIAKEDGHAHTIAQLFLDLGATP